MDKKIKILFLVTEDWYFCSHRLPLAKEAVRLGFTVVVATRVDRHGRVIEDQGCRIVPLRLRRRSWNPLREVVALLEIVHLYRREQPDIVHHVALKPVLYGSIAAWIARVPRVVNAIAGLGFVFSSGTVAARMLRPLFAMAFRLLLNRRNTLTIVQNKDDFAFLANGAGVENRSAVLIRGAGVDLSEFTFSREPAGKPMVVLASRMLWDKGVGEFVAAARLLRDNGISARFALAGASDSGNLRAVPVHQLQIWHDSGDVEWLGQQADMPALFAESHIVCLPSAYGEGIPKVLIEAAACGRPIVTTDAPGCREVVRHGENGLLVPVRDVPALAAALRRLIEDPELRRSMGQRGRDMAVAEFSVDKVVTQTMDVYDRLLKSVSSVRSLTGSVTTGIYKHERSIEGERPL